MSSLRRRRREVLLLLTMGMVLPSPLWGASFAVNSGTDTAPKTVGNDDIGTIAAGATLSAPTAITWTGGSASPGVVIDNSGTISATTRGIDSAGAFSLGSFTLLNQTGAALIATNNDGLRINTDVASGTIAISNSGTLVSGAMDGSATIISAVSGEGLDLAAIVSATAHIQILNSTGALLGASGDDAIRLGAGTITISNGGLIDATASASRAINLNTSDLANVLSFAVTNGADGAIQAQGDAIRVTAAATTGNPAGIFIVDNAGLIQSAGIGITNNEAIDFGTLASPNETIAITNSASGVIRAADADAIHAGQNTTINNSGRIVAEMAPGSVTANTAIVFESAIGSVNNFDSGSIIGARHGINGTLPITVVNSGTITGGDGSGINLNTPVDTTTLIENRGAITGAAVTGDGNGINVAGLIALDNYGTIRATGVSPSPDDSADGVSAGGGIINNFAGGLIAGEGRGIAINGNGGDEFGPATIYNEGTIDAGAGRAVTVAGTFDNTLTNKGTIIGGVGFGAGNNTLNIYIGSTITGAITGGAGGDTVNLLGSGEGSFGSINGFEVLNVQSGSWTLSTAQAYATASVASGATLTVPGHLGAALTVLSGGRLQGTGTVDSVTVNGTIAPGDPIGRLDVGSIVFAPSSHYEVELTAGGSRDSIVDSSAAVIQDGAVIDVRTRSGAYADSTDYTILTASGGVSGIFSGIISNRPFLIPSLSYTPTTVVLTLTRDTDFLTQWAMTPNETAVGHSLDTSPTNSELFLAAVPLTGSAAAQAFDALSGEIHASLASALFADSRFLANAAFDHLREDHASGRTAFWIEGSAIRNRFRSDGNAAAADANFAGIAAGADYATSNIVRVGLSGGYSSTHEKDPGRSSDGKVKSFHAAAYGGASFDGWNVQGAAGYDWHDVDTSREIAFPGIAEAADASYHAHSIEASGEISYRHAIDAFWLEPLGRFDWVQLKTDAFAESGGVTALSGTQQSQQVEFLTAGVRTGARFAEGGMGLTPHILLAWQHSVGDRTPASPLSFQNTGVSFMTNGAPIDTDSLLAGAGLDVAFGDRVKANLSYAGTIGHYVTSHAAMADISVQF